MGLFQVLPRSHASCTDPGFVNPNGPALDIQEVNFLTFIQHYNTRSSSPRKHNGREGVNYYVLVLQLYYVQ